MKHTTLKHWTGIAPVRYAVNMIEKLNLEELSRTLAGAVPPGLVNIGADLEKTFRAILQGSFEHLNLVSREEFEVQKQVLAKTREKLETLETRVAELENRILGDSAP